MAQKAFLAQWACFGHARPLSLSDTSLDQNAFVYDNTGHTRTPDNPPRCLTQCPDQNGASGSSMPYTERTKKGFLDARCLSLTRTNSGSGRDLGSRRAKFPVFERPYTIPGPNRVPWGVCLTHGADQNRLRVPKSGPDQNAIFCDPPCKAYRWIVRDPATPDGIWGSENMSK